MIRRITETVLFLFLCLNLSAQKVTSVDVSGNKEFSKQDYLQWAEIKEGSLVFNGIEDTIKNRITSNLFQNGFISSSITVQNVPTDSAGSILYIKITEGEPALIKKIEISGKDSLLTSSVNFLADELNGLTFSVSLVENLISRALEYCEENGYPFASISISSIIFTKDSSGYPEAEIFLSLEEGMFSRINKIETEGNDKTNSDVIIRQTRIQEDDVYRQSVINAVPSRLNRLAFFEMAEQPQYYFNSKNEGVLKIKVKEKSTNNFDGIIGYNPGDENEKGYLTGFINISLRNLFGTGRAFAIKWEKIDRSSQNLELNYKEPWFLNFPLNLKFGLFQRKQDSTFVRRKITAEAEYLATENFSASVIFSTGETIPAELKNKRFTVWKSDNTETGVNLNYDIRDDIFSPRSGILLNSTFLVSRKRITGPEEYLTDETETKINLNKIEIDFHFYQQIFKNQIIALKLHGRELAGNKTELSDLYLMGGTNSLRGYRENQFAGNRILWENLEYRLLLGGRSFAFLFADAGYYLRKEDPEYLIPETESFKTGFGAGINIETGIGVISISYALGEGDSFSNGKIHFGLVNEF